MARVTYFPRYSNPENVVTNTTLHLFSQIYQHSAERFQELLSELLGDIQMPLGVSFEQQIRSGASVPDGVIRQEPVHIVIETKVTAGVDVGQLIRHCESFQTEVSGNFLILLTKAEVSDEQVAIVHEKAKEFSAKFYKFTFEDLCKALRKSALVHEIHLRHVVDDFANYCVEMSLLPDRRKWVSIVPCGDTYDLNERYEMYYKPTDRGYEPVDYIGIYRWKAVQLIGEITAVYDNEKDAAGEMQLKLVRGEDRSVFRERIRNMARETKEQVGWDITSGTRFFCSDHFLPTQFVKSTPYGIMGGRYEDISKQVTEAKSSLENLAEILRHTTWG